jgi:DNA-binding CsgD family transcriptional regulator
MASPHPVSPDALTEKELEVLRLLAAGHTVKSIAAGLDRSEASINERLRDARRKTGVGSSRELARLLDAQKIWDRKIDLSQHEGSGERPSVPRHQGFAWTKGRIAMAFLLPAAALGLALTAGSMMPKSADTAQPVAAQAPVAESPLAGRWSLDVARLPEDQRPVSVTITFEPVAGGRWHTLVIIKTGDGAMHKAESTAALDGVAVPVGGSMAEIDSVSLRQPEADTLVMTLGKAGKRVSTRVYTVAKDGKSMTETIVWAAEGMPDIVTTTFNRMG